MTNTGSVEVLMVGPFRPLPQSVIPVSPSRVIPNLFRNLLLVLAFLPKDPETSSG